MFTKFKVSIVVVNYNNNSRFVINYKLCYDIRPTVQCVQLKECIFRIIKIAPTIIILYSYTKVNFGESLPNRQTTVIHSNLLQGKLIRIDQSWPLVGHISLCFH